MNISIKQPGQKHKGRRGTHSTGRAVSMFEPLETRVLYSAAVVNPMLDSFHRVGSHMVVPNQNVHGETTALPVPTVISPGTTNASGATLTSTTTPTFTWKAITSSITGFRLNLYDVTAKTFVSYTTGAGATSFTLPNALPAGHTFEWNLRVLAGTRTGNESAYLFFQTPKPTVVPTMLPIPTAISPGTNNSAGVTLITTTPTFTWTSGTAGITGFQLNLYDFTAKKLVSYQISATAKRFTVPTALVAGDSFAWNLQVVNGSTIGRESASLFFQTAKTVVPVVPVTPSTLPVPTLVSPGTNNSAGTTVTSTTPTFTWTSSTTGITGFQLNLYDVTTKQLVSYQVPATATSFTVPTALNAGDTFVWNLRVVDGSVTGHESAYLSFTTHSK